jgi:hypothetical protein
MPRPEIGAMLADLEQRPGKDADDLTEQQAARPRSIWSRDADKAGALL